MIVWNASSRNVTFSFVSPAPSTALGARNFLAI